LIVLRRGVEKALKQEVAERERHRAEATVFLGKRLKQLANEREKLLKAYYADAIDVDTLKREQARINTEVEEAEAQLSREGAKLKKAAEVIQLALNLAESCPDAYLKARPDVRKLWNQAFFRKILVMAGPSAQAEVLYEEPFASLLDSQEDVGSHNSRVVEVAGRCVNRIGLFEALYQASPS
jgi:site-specific DNA recombinase